ncbi:XdhC family protein [Rhodovulum sp. 12E13]|uniref:XdhC family protein n=1 Tax=Rhodovulum sp. 12E13 TaxID=2203891 RepID=UPI001F3D7883|nr:XdhC family protein [Rhodovulum sp. 12E13]
MKPAALTVERIDALAREMRTAGTPFATATIVRTMDSTSAGAGARALLSAEGELIEGWVGGGCVRAALGRAARSAVARGEPVLVALRPDDRLAAEGAEPCEVRDGMIYERNGCASKGSMDVFVEPFVPLPDLVVMGEGPVARALRALARGFDFRLCEAATGPGAYVVVATQGKGDARALAEALGAGAAHVAFVGSRRKAAALREKLAGQGADAAALAALSAPAGLDIGAETPDEIALSILAEIVQVRRKGAR